jgi:hypothetical protein
VTLPAALLPVLKSPYPHRPRLLFLLKRRQDVSHETFEQALLDWRRQRQVDVGFGGVAVRAGVVIPEEQELINARFRAGGTEVKTIDAYVSLDLESYEPTAADFETLISASGGCFGVLTDSINPAESVAFAGIANLVIPGVAPRAMILLLDRAQGLSIEQYNEWWVRHGDDHRRLNPAQVGYHQLHVAPELNAAAAAAAAVGVSTTDQCVIDVMYLGRLRDAFPTVGNRSREEERALSADIAAHVSMATVTGSFMREL